jgi:hypothetical protein
MAPHSKTKEKTARKRYGQQRWIVDWTIEPASVPGHVRLSLSVAGESADSACSSTTRHYLLQHERIVDLVRELTGTLEHSRASRALEERALAAGSQDPADRASEPDAGEHDSSGLSSHFLLGAYGLVGN